MTHTTQHELAVLSSAAARGGAAADGDGWAGEAAQLSSAGGDSLAQPHDGSLLTPSSPDPASVLMPQQSRECRICLHAEAAPAALVAPCACSGTAKWAHMACLENWCRENAALWCEVCKTRCCWVLGWANCVRPLGAGVGMLRQTTGWVLGWGWGWRWSVQVGGERQRACKICTRHGGGVGGMGRCRHVHGKGATGGAWGPAVASHLPLPIQSAVRRPRAAACPDGSCLP